MQRKIKHENMQSLESRLFMSATPLSVTTVTTPLGTELVVTGTHLNDVINIGQQSNGLIINDASGWSMIWTKHIVGIEVNAGAGNDKINIKSNIKVAVELFGGAGNDTLIGGSGSDTLYGGAGADAINGEAGNDVIVDVGDGSKDTVTGGAGTDSFWVDPSDVVTDLASGESSGGDLHRISKFATAVTNSNAPAGTTFGAEPTLDSGASSYANFGNDPLFSSSGPSDNDIRQGQLGDCFLLASYGSIAKVDPNMIRQSIVALGDGTYAAQFISGSSKVYVRIDAELPVNAQGSLAYAQLGAQSSIWAAMMEKAYAVFQGSSNYNNLNGGFMGDVYQAMGLQNNTIFSASDGTDLLSSFAADLKNGDAVTFGTIANVPDGVPMIGDHAYVVDAVITDSNGTPTSIRLRNPWGFDGAGSDSNPNDGYVTITAAQAMDVFWFACAAKA